MLGWYGDLTPAQKRTFWACWAGWGLDAMDFQLYFFVIPTLIALWHVTNVEAGFIATGTILASALGGWVTGVLGDRYGRARILLVTVVWYAVATFLCGFAQGPRQLGFLRALVGIGFGGEWAIGAILVGEIVRASERGRAVGTVQSAYGVGWAAAALAYGACFSVFEADIAWRVLFWKQLLPWRVCFTFRAWSLIASGSRRAWSGSAPARPSIARFGVFSLLTWPSACPLLQLSVVAFLATSRSLPPRGGIDRPNLCGGWLSLRLRSVLTAGAAPLRQELLHGSSCPHSRDA